MSRPVLPWSMITDIGLIFFSITEYGKPEVRLPPSFSKRCRGGGASRLCGTGNALQEHYTCMITARRWVDVWLPYCRGHFQMQFTEWKLLNFNQNFIKISSLGFNWQHVFIVSHRCSVPNRRHVIISTNCDLVYWCINASVGLNVLTYRPLADVVVISKVYIQIHFTDKIHEHLLRNATGSIWWEVKIGSGKSMVPSDERSLLEPMLARSIPPHSISRS